GAIAEAKNLMMSSRNILSAADGHPVVAPTQDVVLGCYWLTAVRTPMPEGEAAGKLRTFSGENEVLLAHHSGSVGLQDWIRVRVRGSAGAAQAGELVVTPPGRVISTQVRPVGRPPVISDSESPERVRPLPFQNGHFDRKALRALISVIFQLYGNEVTAETANE